jgi:hypothetical protein
MRTAKWIAQCGFFNQIDFAPEKRFQFLSHVGEIE